jgi:hypothetical protein
MYAIVVGLVLYHIFALLVRKSYQTREEREAGAAHHLLIQTQPPCTSLGHSPPLLTGVPIFQHE